MRSGFLVFLLLEFIVLIDLINSFLLRSVNSFHQSSLSKNSIFHSINRESQLNDFFESKSFHHVEFYTGEAFSTSCRFSTGLGLNFAAKSDCSNGNSKFGSYLVQSKDVKMLFTAPYGDIGSKNIIDSNTNLKFDPAIARNFISNHGLGVRAIAIEVSNVQDAYDIILSRGGVGVTSPYTINDTMGIAEIAEISLYGDTVLRLINTDNYNGEFLPGFSTIENNKTIKRDFHFQRFDHIVGNVWELAPVRNYIKTITGFHEFAEFEADDVGTIDSGLNSVVLANNNEYILLPVNEPTFGTKRKSQIQTFLEQNNGAGVQHLALFTNDIFSTLVQMKQASDYGTGFKFMAPPPPFYYENLENRLGPNIPLNKKELEFAKSIGLLLDKDDKGFLLQIFTEPIGDRPTIFLEIIQRLGCVDENTIIQKPGCGGFGKGNFKDLFKSIEEFENKLGINLIK